MNSRRWMRTGLIVALAALLYFALRQAPMAEIGHVLARIHLWQIAVLLAVDGLIYGLVTGRWWLVVRAERPTARFLPMLAVRLSVFGVSYFTIGPQIGGEPLQVLYLQREQGLTYTRATASVILDKLFELLSNFVLLSFGLLAVFHSGILRGSSAPSQLAIVILVLVVSWPLAHIVLLRFGVYPISVLIGLLGRRRRGKTARFIQAAEHLAGQFCRRHTASMAAILGVSLLAALATVSEYALIASFLQIRLPFWALVTAWTSGWLAFLAPLPGGLGALEASQVWTLGFYGITAAAAVSVALLMRARDLLIGGVGLLLAGGATWKPGHPKNTDNTYA
ncbi:MAG TPA: lysylphosphatidylglycerol synthase transmembrane domain-containing protein [Anaerolineales bacterium]|nr:lysylphosphatidylglycerol synthase transmembrane domain-containing protein [Anaerolineales bacterium]